MNVIVQFEHEIRAFFGKHNFPRPGFPAIEGQLAKARIGRHGLLNIRAQEIAHRVPFPRIPLRVLGDLDA